MNRKEFEQVTPESVGVPSSAVHGLIDKLEEGWTEPHGLILMRHGKIFSKGWWSPYAPGIRHVLVSHSKTYAATAVGIAYTEGLLRLDERLVDIFPDKVPENPSENLKKLTIRDVLCMGTGMEKEPMPLSYDWIRDFLAVPVGNEPGKAFFYNNTGSTMLGAIVREKTGLGLHDYLKPRLFDKVGIYSYNHRWRRAPDGMELGGFGLSATTEDNLRLIKLYANGGVWDGERILAEDYVKMATSFQNDNASEAKGNPQAFDNFVGYGFQIWMCRPEGVYRADGAMGQFSIVIPDKDMIIGITENAVGHWAQGTLDAMWEFLKQIPDAETLPEDNEASDKLARRMSSLALPNEPFMPFSPMRGAIDGTSWRVATGNLSLGGGFGSFRNSKESDISDFSFRFTPDVLEFTVKRSGKEYALIAAMDGSRMRNIYDGAPALLSAYWTADNTLRIVFRGVESNAKQALDFTFSGTGCAVEDALGLFRFGKPEPITAARV